MTAADVITRTGCTYRQLSYWCSRGYIPGQPRDPGTGCHRDFTPTQLRHVARLVRLIDAGMNVADATDALVRGVETHGRVEAVLSPHVRVIVTDRTT